MKLRERGLVGRYLTHFSWDSSISCPKKEVVYRENLGIQDVFTAFGLLLAGLGLSILIFILEKFNHSRHTPNPRTEKKLKNLV